MEEVKMKDTGLFRTFIKYVSLNIVGMLGISFYILADTFFIARGVGEDGLTALNLAIPVYNFAHGCALMFGMGGATKYSIYKSQGKQKKMDAVFMNTVYMGIIFAIFFVCCGLFLSEQITGWLGANEKVFEMTNTYLKVILQFSPMFIFNEIFLCFFRNDGNPKLTTIAMLAGSISNIVFDYILIFIFNMGILGAVLATGCSPIISITIMFISYHRKKQKGIPYGFGFRKTNMESSLIKSTVSIGIPSLVTEFSSGIVIIVFNYLILGIEKNTGVAAYGVIANLSLVVISVFTGMGQGIQPIISRSYGTGEQKSVKKILKYAVLATICLSVILYGMIYLNADSIAGLFNSEKNAHLQKMAVEGLKLYFLGTMFAGLNIVISSYFAAIEKSIPAQVISVLRGIAVIIPVSILFAVLYKMTGIWWSFPVAEGITCLISIGMLCMLKGQKGERNENTVTRSR